MWVNFIFRYTFKNTSGRQATYTFCHEENSYERASASRSHVQGITMNSSLFEKLSTNDIAKKTSSETSGSANYVLCPVCKKRIRNLRQHMKIHSEKKPFICSICQKTFKFKCNLRTHCLLHTGDVPFSCKLCGCGFRQKSNLKVHYLRKHSFR